MILCDVGNSRIHCFDGKRVEHLAHDEGILRYRHEAVRYICVSESARKKIAEAAPAWRELTAEGLFETRYEGMGIDRIAACLGAHDGVVVDAGSAVTVDVMEKGSHLGGWILPGLAAWRESLRRISPRLDLPLTPEAVPGGRLPLSTPEAVAFGFFASVRDLVARHAKGRRVLLTGGDAETLAAVLPGAEVDETLIFRGMEKMKTKDTTC